ncbi:hypothetical protein [Phaffia rhodozyma]|uniref:Uncharacterized protein n=1 Tax=Phaffia rhodozyma TaxID=264483 RepID=A0A0F7SPW5_PHARH|nr:hypothetical protein [Phaffia rhodozyma]
MHLSGTWCMYTDGQQTFKKGSHSSTNQTIIILLVGTKVNNMSPLFPAATLVDRAPFRPFPFSTIYPMPRASSSVLVASSSHTHASIKNGTTSSGLSRSVLIAVIISTIITGLVLSALIGYLLYRRWNIRRNQSSESPPSTFAQQDRDPRLSSSSSTRTLFEKDLEKSDRMTPSTRREKTPITSSASSVTSLDENG